MSRVLLGFILPLVKTDTDGSNERQIDTWGDSDKVLPSKSVSEPRTIFLIFAHQGRRKVGKTCKKGTQHTVCFSPKIWRTLKKLLEMCATGRPPYAISAERSNQSPFTSNSASWPSEAFVKCTVEREERTRMNGLALVVK